MVIVSAIYQVIVNHTAKYYTLRAVTTSESDSRRTFRTAATQQNDALRIYRAIGGRTRNNVTDSI